MKGLICSIFESKAHGNCSNSGVSSRFKSVTLCPDYDANCGFGIPEVFVADTDAPAVVLRAFRVSEDYEYIYAVPVELVEKGDGGWMFGGSFIFTSDSRFPARHPIPLHDRVEEGRGYAD
jgi:hypothetical protein